MEGGTAACWKRWGRRGFVIYALSGAQTLRSLQCHVLSVTAWAAGCVLLNQQHHVPLPCLALANPEKKQHFPGCSLEVT